MNSRGYIHGVKAAAAYMGVSRKTLWNWQSAPEVPAELKSLLRPRIIQGRNYFSVAKLDRFMDPANNTEQAYNPNV